MKWYWTHKHSLQHEKHQPGCMWSVLRTLSFHRSHSVRRLLSGRTHGDDAGAVIDKMGFFMMRPCSMLLGSGLNSTSSNGKSNKGYFSVDNVADGDKLEAIRVSDVNSDLEPVKTVASNEIPKNNHRERSLSASERRNLAEEGQKQKSRTAKIVHNPQSEYEGSSKQKKRDPTYSKSIERFTDSINQATSVLVHSWASELESQEMHDILEKTTEDLINQKFHEAECLSNDSGIHNPKELMDALKILNSNKELFIKLLHDPNSLLVKHIEGLRNAHRLHTSVVEPTRPAKEAELSRVNIYEELSKNNVHKSSKVKHKLCGRASKAGQGERAQNSTKIVLKPGSPGVEKNMGLTSTSSSPDQHCSLKNQDGKKVASYFSVKQFKRKLKLAADAKGEKCHLSKDDILHLSSYNSQVSEHIKSAADSQPGGESSEPTRLTTIRRNESWKENKWIAQGVIVDELSSPRGSKYLESNNITYSRSLSLPRKSDRSESKKSLYELLNAKDANESSLDRSPRRTLGKLLSIPDYSLLSPRLCPRGDSSDEVRASLSCEHHDIEYSSCFKSGNGTSTEWQSPLREDWELKTPLISEELFSSFIVGNAASTKIEESMNDVLVDNSEEDVCTEGTQIPKDDGGAEPSDAAEGISKPRLSVLPVPDFIKVQLVDPSDSFFFSSTEEMESIMTSIVVEHPTLDSQADKVVLPQPLSTFQVSYQSVLSGTSCENPQQPSPASVLELACSDDDSSPGTCVSPQQVNVVLKPRKLHFEAKEDSDIVDGLLSSGYIHDRSGTASATSDSKMEDSDLGLKGTDLEYMRLLLEASNLTSIQAFDERWDSSSQPLDKSLFLFIDPPSEVSVDRLLLFDCINEALTEISEQYLACQSLVTSTRRHLQPSLVRDGLLEEVWKHVNSQLPLHSKTLDQYIEGDIVKSGKWLELSFDIECIGEEIELCLFEDLIEDTVMEVAS